MCWSHNSRYHGVLLTACAAHCQEALEIGCGTGAFARLLAERAPTTCWRWIWSPNMIRIAAERSARYLNIDLQVGDVMDLAVFSPGSLTASLRSRRLHHLPLEEIVPKLKEALRPGGTLLILDLYRWEGLAGPAQQRAGDAGEPRPAPVEDATVARFPEVRQAWEAHGQHDPF